ncbi:MAG: hypothetical protein E7464_08530 [Ruminococcaceae bacterium]|nr:hypothetical protein [Oscillospiraceae bacterium]
MMYGEVRWGISEHTLVCGNTTSSSSERSEYVGFALPDSDSLPVPDKLTKAIVPDGIILRQKEMRKMGTVNFLFTAFLLCDKIEKKEEA